MLDAANELGRRKLTVERDHALGDVLGEIANTLQVIGEPQGADDFAQVDRHGLAAGDGVDRLFLDFALQVIDIGVGGGNPLRQRGIALGQCIDRVGDLFFCQAAHFGDHAPEVLQVAVEGLRGVFGHCCHPVGRSHPLSRSGR